MARSRQINIVLCIIFIYHLTLSQLCYCATHDDDELIQNLLKYKDKSDAPGEESQLAQILKAVEAAEQTATEKPTDPFFQTPSPISRRTGVADDEVISQLEKSFEESLKESPKWKRSDPHDPPIGSLLWRTAGAMWDIARPSFYKTKTGATVGVIRDTIQLPLKTFGHIKSGILDLTNPYGKRSAGWGGYGWDHPVTYVKYEPENSLFKSWIRYILRLAGPAVMNKIRLKRALFRLQIYALRRAIQLIKAAKFHKGIAGTSLLGALVRRKIRPQIVVLKETDHAHGWNVPTSSWSGSSGWDWGGQSHQNGGGWSHATQSGHGGHGPQGSYQHQSLSIVPPPTRTSTNPYSGKPNYNPPGLDSRDHWRTASSEARPQIESPSYDSYLKSLGINPALLDSPDGSRSLRESEKDKSKDVPYLIADTESTSKKEK